MKAVQMTDLRQTTGKTILKNNSYINANFPGNLGTQLGEEIWTRLQNGWEGTDWVEEMSMKNAPVQNHSLNITGSSKDVTYALGVSYFDQAGIIGGDLINAGYKRLTARLNSEMVLVKGATRDIITIGENFHAYKLPEQVCGNRQHLLE
jgi:TonB-dependent starch-binding outer membrane protein SusC